MPPEVLQWLPRSAVYVFGLVVLSCIVIQKLCETKVKVANAFGPPGRAIYRRAKARAKRSAGREDDYRLLQWRIDKQDKLIRRNEADAEARYRKLQFESEARHCKLEADIQKLELVGEANAAQQDMTAEYLREEAEWYLDTSMLAAEERWKGWRPHRSYTQFCSEYRVKHGMATGRRWSDEPKR